MRTLPVTQVSRSEARQPHVEVRHYDVHFCQMKRLLGPLFIVTDGKPATEPPPEREHRDEADDNDLPPPECYPPIVEYDD